jgi:hypothetical protein
MQKNRERKRRRRRGRRVEKMRGDEIRREGKRGREEKEGVRRTCQPIFRFLNVIGNSTHRSDVMRTHFTRVGKLGRLVFQDSLALWKKKKRTEGKGRKGSEREKKQAKPTNLCEPHCEFSSSS